MKKSSFINLLLLGAICYRLFGFFPGFETLFSKSYNYEMYKNVYEGSQYMQARGGSVPDETIYSYAAGYYLYGGSPILVNPEHPPLGKYIIGLSIALFQNTAPAIYLFFYVTLLGFFLIARKTIGSMTWSLIATNLFLLDNMYVNQIKFLPLLDIIQLGFIMFAFYFFIRWMEKNRSEYLIMASICLGAVISVKFFITGVLIGIAWTFFLFFHQRKKIVHLVLAMGMAAYGMLLISYVRLLVHKPDLLEVIRIQKWILWYQQSKAISFFSIWPLIFFNRWQTWWGDYSVIKDGQWSIRWPLLFIFSFCTLIYALKKRTKEIQLQILLTWLVVYCISLSFSQASSRYLIPILPFLYIISIKGIVLCINDYRKKRSR